MAPLLFQLDSSKTSSHHHYSFPYSFYSIHRQVSWWYLWNPLKSHQFSHLHATIPWIYNSFLTGFPASTLDFINSILQKGISMLFQRNKFGNIIPLLKSSNGFMMHLDYNWVSYYGLWGHTWRDPRLPCSLCFSHTGLLSFLSTSPNCSYLKALLLIFSLCLECPTPPCGRLLLII